MIRLVSLLRKHRSFVLLALALPLLGLLLDLLVSGGPRLQVMPQREFPTFEVLFATPGIQAVENLRRVTEVAERIFNGAPGLLHLQSTTRDEHVSLKLIFHKRFSDDQATLFLQERIDRLKLELPRDVTRIEVNPVYYAEPADLSAEFSDPISIERIRQSLGTLLEGVTRSIPDLALRSEVRIVPEPLALSRERMPLSQILQALRASGVLASIGEKAGIVYQLGSRFRTLDDLKGLVVGARGHRPITLQQVARVDFVPSPTTNKVSLWLDESRATRSEVGARLRSMDASIRSTANAQEQIFRMLLLPVFGFLIVVVLQTVFARIIFGGWSMLWLMLVFDMLLGAHFFFWLVKIRGQITLPDLTAFLLSVTVGSMYFMILFARIRSFFLPRLVLPKTIESTEQASLFGLAELLPTFLCLSLALYFLSMGLLSTDLNTPSRLVLSSFFSFGLPNVFVLLIFVPAVIDNHLIKTALSVPHARLTWSMSRPQVLRLAVACWLLAFAAPVVFYLMPIGIGAREQKMEDDDLHQLLREARGYGSSLNFLRSVDPFRTSLDAQKVVGISTVLANRSAPYKLMEFSPVGLRHLAALDVIGFQQALRSFAAGDAIGFLETENDSMAIKVSSRLIRTEDLGDLTLAAKASNGDGKNLRLLVDMDVERLPNEIHRNRMQVSDWVEVDPSQSRGNLKYAAPSDLLPTQWTSYLLRQLNEFNVLHLSVVAFLYFLLSIYLNSFVRAGTVVGLLGLPYAIASGIRLILPGVVHADSLWIFAFVPWLTLVQILSLARVVDVERTRGHDRDLVVDECRIQLAPSVFIASLFFAVTIAVLGTVSLSQILPDPGLWQEGLIAGILCATLGWLTARYIFPLFYLEAEETVERLLIRTVLWFRQR